MDHHLQSLKPNSFSSFTDFTNPNFDPTPQNPTLNNFTDFIPFSNDMLIFSNPPQEQVAQNISQTINNFQQPPLNSPVSALFLDIKKRKSMDVSETTSGISTPQVSESGLLKTRNNSLGKGKRLKSIEKEEEKSAREVVHVRARRGQATDSHSLAERVRRGKINERLRCLKDIVPGCYKTMGMAVMLDEIINYVQSLQNQVEFLSMKLAAASSFHDFNSEADAILKLQRAKANEAKELERLMREAYGGVANCFHSTLPL